MPSRHGAPGLPESGSRQLTLLVCGSRGWTDRARIADVLAAYGDDRPLIIHGDAPGADTLAAAAASQLGYSVRAFPPDHARYGDQARPMRNIAMLENRPDKVIAFLNDDSPGTRHTIAEARKRGIPVEVHADRIE